MSSEKSLEGPPPCGESPFTAEDYYNKGGKVPRNGPCPCGSGRKFKACCWPGIRDSVKSLQIVPKRTKVPKYVADLMHKP